MARKRIEQESVFDEDVNIDLKSITKTKDMSLTGLPGVGPSTAEKLALSGFDNLMAIAVATVGEIVEATGLTDVMARKVIQASRASMDMGFLSGEEVMAKRLLVTKFPTFWKEDLRQER
jgi:endonuclease III